MKTAEDFLTEQGVWNYSEGTGVNVSRKKLLEMLEQYAKEYHKSKQKEELNVVSFFNKVKQFVAERSFKTSDPKYRTLDFNTFFDDCEKWVDDLISQQLTQGGDKWISVEDRLPEINQDCIVYVQPHPKYKHLPFGVDRIGFSSINAGSWPRISHWMPLPEPPNNLNP